MSFFFLFCFFFQKNLNLTSKFITYYRYTNNSSSTLPHPPPNIEMTREGTNPPITLSPLLYLFITSPLRSAKLAFLFDTFIYSHFFIFTLNPPSPPSLFTSLLQNIFNVTILSPISFWRVGGVGGGWGCSLVPSYRTLSPLRWVSLLAGCWSWTLYTARMMASLKLYDSPYKKATKEIIKERDLTLIVNKLNHFIQTKIFKRKPTNLLM